MGDLELTFYPDEAGFRALREEWNALLRRSRTETIFLTWEWQTAWWRCLGAPRGPLVLLAAREAGRLIGILPLYLTTEGAHTLQVVGCIEVADYLDLIVEAGQEEPVYRAFLDWLAGEGKTATGWELVDLCNQPSASLAHALLPEMARARGWTADVVQEDVCPIVTLPPIGPDGWKETWEAYLAMLDKKERHEIRRKLRRAEREAPDLNFRIVSTLDGLDEAMTEFIRLHQLSSRDKSDFMTPEMQTFFREIAAMAADNGWLRLYFLETGGQAVSSYFCFDYHGDILVYNSGYDPAANPQLSFGWVLLSKMIQDAIVQGRQRVDFLQGDEDYKYRFGGVDTPVYRTIVRQDAGPAAAS